MGHLNGILARVGRNLNNNFRKSQIPGGGMLKLRFDRYVTKEAKKVIGEMLQKTHKYTTDI